MTDLIDAHLDYLRAAGQSDRTHGERQEVLRRLHNELPYGLAFAETAQLDAWLAQPGWSGWTRYTYAGHIRAFYRWAARGAHLPSDPALDMVRPAHPRSIPDPVTDEELAAALRLSADPWFIGVVLAAYAGLRADEIARCRREDVSAERIHIPRGKGGHPGSVPTHAYLWSVVENRPPGPLFVSRKTGRAVVGRSLPAAARRHFDRIGLPDVHLHRLRHWYGTTIQQLGGDIRVTQECLRHASLASTQGYTLVASGRRSAAVALLPVLDAG